MIAVSEYVVEQREVVRRDVFDAQRLLQQPMLAAKPGGGGQKLLRVKASRPVLLDRSLQLSANADPRESKFAAIAIQHAPMTE